MTIEFSTTSLKDYKSIPEHIRKKFKKRLELLATQGVTYPGLGAQKMTNQAAIWEARIDYHYRFTFHMEGDAVLIRRVGTHEIYRNP